jgi:serine/threonine-protein phosphatase 2A activator
MYFSAIGFINDVKKGPFWEHSPILFDISGIRDGWGKINKGMIKMFNAEVLSKFPVVQHFPFGTLFSWDLDPEAPEPAQSIHMVNQPIATAATAGPNSHVGSMPPPMGARWAGQTTRIPGGVPSEAGTYSSRSSQPGPRTGSLASKRPPPAGEDQSTAAPITVTKAPWAK